MPSNQKRKHHPTPTANPATKRLCTASTARGLSKAMQRWQATRGYIPQIRQLLMMGGVPICTDALSTLAIYLGVSGPAQRLMTFVHMDINSFPLCGTARQVFTRACYRGAHRISNCGDTRSSLNGCTSLCYIREHLNEITGRILSLEDATRLIDDNMLARVDAWRKDFRVAVGQVAFTAALHRASRLDHSPVEFNALVRSKVRGHFLPFNMDLTWRRHRE
jgi:hypothetical protein